MNKVLFISLGILMLSDVSYSMMPVYSAQASSDFNSNINGQQSNGNQNSSNQNNSGNNNYGNNNSNNQNNVSNNNGNNNGGQGGYNQPNTLTTNNNGSYSANNSRQNNNGGNSSNGYSGNNNSNNSNNGSWGNNNGNNNNGNNNNNNNNSYNNGNNNNQQMNNGQPNVFTENYAMKGTQFRANVYKKDGNGRLYKTSLSSNDLQKAIIIFFGDWCPHCSRFLGNFSKNMPALTQAGVKIIFIGVPTIDRLQNWQEPNDNDFNDHLQKLNGFGIQTGNNSELVLLGDKASLNNNAVDSLPTMMAVSNGKECFRGGADNSIEKVEFTNQDAVGQFLQVFNSFGNQNTQNSNYNNNNNNPQKSFNNNSNRQNYGNHNSTYHGKVDISEANMFTEILNRGCNLSCAVKEYVTPYQYQSSSCPPCPVCPACPVCPQCPSSVPQQQTVQNSVQEVEGNYSAPKDDDTCTTCGCKFKRALSKHCGTAPKKSTQKKCKTRKCCVKKR